MEEERKDDDCDDEVLIGRSKDLSVDKECTRNLYAFFICGLINNFGYVVMLSAAEDICTGQAGIILLADILPTLLLKATAPFFMHRIHYSVRIVTVTILGVLAFIIVAIFNPLWQKILGVVLASISAGGGEITFLALSSHFHRDTISTWSSGTGGAGIAGSLAYLLLTVWVGLSTRIALLICSPFPLLISIGYFVVMRRRQRNVFVEIGSEITPVHSLSLIERSRYLLPLLKYMFPLFFVYYCEYTINHGVAPAIWFDDAPFSRRAHYVYYFFLYQSGVFISRSSVNFFPIKRIWLPSLLQFINLVILFIHACYSYIPYVWFVFAIILYEGLLGGATYVNAFFLISTEVDKEHREFSLGVTSVADSFGIALAGLTSVFLEPWLLHRQ